MLEPGEYAVRGESTAADGHSYMTEGSLTLHCSGAVSGMLTEGAVAGGSWVGCGAPAGHSAAGGASHGASGQLSFLLVYNAEMPFLYSLRVRRAQQGPDEVRCKGTWTLDGARGVADGYHGKCACVLAIMSPMCCCRSLTPRGRPPGVGVRHRACMRTR